MMPYLLWHQLVAPGANAYLHFLAELGGEGDTVKVVAVWTVVDGYHIEEYGQEDKEAHRQDQADHDADDFTGPVALVEVDEWQEGKGQQKAEEEAKQVGIVVDVRQQANYKEDKE